MSPGDAPWASCRCTTFTSGLRAATDLYAGDASFAQVIFRDRKSRAHFIPAGRKPFPATLSPDLLG